MTQQASSGGMPQGLDPAELIAKKIANAKILVEQIAPVLDRASIDFDPEDGYTTDYVRLFATVTASDVGATLHSFGMTMQELGEFIKPCFPKWNIRFVESDRGGRSSGSLFFTADVPKTW